MTNTEILQRLQAVCTALNNLTVTGVKNAGNLAGSHTILQEIMASLADATAGAEADADGDQA